MPKQPPKDYVGSMCPQGLALEYPAADLLEEFAVNGCPTKTGTPWTKEQLEAAIAVGSHVSTMVPEVMKQLQMEV